MRSTILTTPDSSNKQYKHPPLLYSPQPHTTQLYYNCSSIRFRMHFYTVSSFPNSYFGVRTPKGHPLFHKEKLIFTLTLANCFIHFYWRYLQFVAENPYLIGIFSIKTPLIEYLIRNISKKSLFLLDFTFFLIGNS